MKAVDTDYFILVIINYEILLNAKYYHMLSPTNIVKYLTEI